MDGVTDVAMAVGQKENRRFRRFSMVSWPGFATILNLGDISVNCLIFESQVSLISNKSGRYSRKKKQKKPVR